ncbi:MAG: hypothetical protein WCI04_06280 [archaeon]
MLSVLDNAYLRKAQEHPYYSPTHQKILLFLMHEKKYYEKGELICLANHSLETLDEALNQLEKEKLITIEGWLVRLVGETGLFDLLEENKTIVIENKPKRKIKQK